MPMSLGSSSGARQGSRVCAVYINGTIIFTTKPFAIGALFQGEIRAMEISTGKVSTLWRLPNLANGATIGPDGRLYVCFQGQQTSVGNGDEYLSGVYSIDPCDASGAVRLFEKSEW